METTFIIKKKTFLQTNPDFLGSVKLQCCLDSQHYTTGLKINIERNAFANMTLENAIKVEGIFLQIV